MKRKIMSGVSLCFSIAGIIFLVYNLFTENEIPGLLPLGLMCVTLGNLTSRRFCRKQEEQ